MTHYRVSRSLRGPWLAPADDAFDGRAFYAAKTAVAKTAGDGGRRYLYGWLATREGETDGGRWQWGGDLVVHELVQQGDGTLAVRPPGTVLAPFTRLVPLAPRPVLGRWDTSAWSVNGERISAQAVGRFSALTLGELPQACLVEAEVTFAPGTANPGLLLRADQALEAYYQVRLEPGNGRIVFDRWPRPGDQPFMIERPLAVRAGEPVRLRVLVDDTCVVIYASDQVALSCRMYDHRQGQLGLFVAEGEARFEGVRVRVR